MSIKQIRMKHYLTQGEMAKKLDSSLVSVFNWEHGLTTMSLRKRKKFVEVFGVDPLNPDSADNIDKGEN